MIERERNELGSNLTRVTLESFLAWKKRKLKEKKEAALREEEKKRNDFKAGRQIGVSNDIHMMFKDSTWKGKKNQVTDNKKIGIKRRNSYLKN